MMRNRSGCALEVASISAQDFTRHPIGQEAKKKKINPK